MSKIGPIPIKDSSRCTSCGEVISSNCVSWTGGGVDGIQVCDGATVTDIIQSLATAEKTCCDANSAAISNLLSELTGLQTDNINWSLLNWGCLTSTTVDTYSCPTGWVLVNNSGVYSCQSICGPNSYIQGYNSSGAAICGSCGPPTAPPTGLCIPPIPILNTTTIPLPAPATLLGALQAIINFLQPMCNCNPCLQK